MKKLIMIAAMACSVTLMGQTQPTTRPAGEVNPDQMLKQLLSPTQRPKPLEPITLPRQTSNSSDTPPPPKPDTSNLIREGQFIVNRIGRLTRTPEGQQELTFESDGTSLKDPPMLVLPNLKLAEMENYIRKSSRDLQFRVTGMVTEYNNRNYILLQKIIVVDGSLLPKPGDEKK